MSLHGARHRRGKHGAGSRGLRVLLVTPPLVQPNAPYAATPALTGFLLRRGVRVSQADASLELVLRLFSQRGVAEVARVTQAACRRSQILRANRSVAFFLRNRRRYAATVEHAVRFLQGRAPPLAGRIAGRSFLPEGPRFAALAAWGSDGHGGSDAWMDTGARARYIASLFLDDLADVIRDAVDPDFGFARYGERLSAAAPSFAAVRGAVESPATPVSAAIDEVTASLLKKHRPDVVGFTVPFPGTLVGALRMAREFRRLDPHIVSVVGGGYVSTELRQLGDPALFDFVDYAVLDEGPAPLARLLSHLGGRLPRRRLARTFCREDGRVVFHDSPCSDVPHGRSGPPRWTGLRMDRYLSVMETPSQAFSLWSDGMWIKVMLAHGCYWRRCRFCDTSLPYIRRFDPAPVPTLIRWIRSVCRETGCNRFHFVDEAIPPSLAGRLSEALLEKGMDVTWWGNVRFEPAFTTERVASMRRSGCVAVTGGLETVCDRTLAAMAKGVSLASAVPAIARFSSAGILVHVYLMYGFPGQTVREVVDALEVVRQLFANGLVHSAYWHRFALTVHSAMGADPTAFGMRVEPPARRGFAENEVPVTAGVNPEVIAMGRGLHKAVYNYMHALGLDEDVRSWFTAPVPRPRVGAGLVFDLVRRGLETRD
jgi:hypothetical protein